MTHTYDPLHDAAQQAAAYQVDEKDVTRHRAKMDGFAGMSYAAGKMTASIVFIADQHRRDCSSDVCGTCDQLRGALAVALAAAREMSDQQLARMMRATPEPQGAQPEPAAEADPVPLPEQSKFRLWGWWR